VTFEGLAGDLIRGGSGAPGWLRSYVAMLRWELVGSRLLYPLLLISQVLVGAGFVIGFGLLIPDLDHFTAQYLTTGAVVMSLILVGLVVTPQLVAQQKLQGSYDYLWSLPVPRSAASMASTTLAALGAIPGILSALVVAGWRYDVSLALDPTVVPAFVLTLACGSFLGSAIGHSMDKPQVTILFTQLGIFFIVGFSPVSFPVERLPGWLATLHEYLPMHHMALAVRSSLTEGLVVMAPRSWLVLSLWTTVAGIFAGIVLVRRR
jgi:ABC-2 type transport system permease protein